MQLPEPVFPLLVEVRGRYSNLLELLKELFTTR
jgi:hypothetical protein